MMGFQRVYGKMCISKKSYAWIFKHCNKINILFFRLLFFQNIFEVLGNSAMMTQLQFQSLPDHTAVNHTLLRSPIFRLNTWESQDSNHCRASIYCYYNLLWFWTNGSNLLVKMIFYSLILKGSREGIKISSFECWLHALSVIFFYPIVYNHNPFLG